MTPAREALASAYEDGVRDGRDAAAREFAAEIEGLRADLKETQHEARVLRLRCANYAQLEEQFQAMSTELGRMRSQVIDSNIALSHWEPVARELRQLLARNQTIEFKPSPGPARLLLGHLGLQGLGMDGLLSALAVVAEECKPCLIKT